MTTTDVQKWADKHMFVAEKSDAAAGPVAYLLGAPVDPLGQIAACAKMYKGEVVRDLRDVTNEERKDYLLQIQATVLKMPLEAVSLHFMLEGVHRGITHQMVRQRTAAYAQESTRFAVKEDLGSATALPPSLDDTLSLDDLIKVDLAEREALGLQNDLADHRWNEAYVKQLKRDTLGRGGPQAQRLKWDDAIKEVESTYLGLISSGMPAEEARGLMPTNITTRLNYITNLRSFYETIAVRVSDQAQFEWRKVAMAYALAMRQYGEANYYWTTVPFWEYQSWNDSGEFGAIYEREFVNRHDDDREPDVRIRLSSRWQYFALTNEMKPIEFKIGGPAFGANFDRPSRIGERVKAYHLKGIPSSEWTSGSPVYGIPPIHPEEWLLDPNSARLAEGMEFDVFGNRVPVGTGWHWDQTDCKLYRNTNGNQTDGYDEAKWPLDFEEEM